MVCKSVAEIVRRTHQMWTTIEALLYFMDASSDTPANACLHTSHDRYAFDLIKNKKNAALIVCFCVSVIMKPEIQYILLSATAMLCTTLPSADTDTHWRSLIPTPIYIRACVDAVNYYYYSVVMLAVYGCRHGKIL